MNPSRPPRRTRTQLRRRRPAEPPEVRVPATRSREFPAPDKVWLYGRHAVAAALANPRRRWRRLAVLAPHLAEAEALVTHAAAPRRGDGEKLQVLDRDGFAALLPPDAVHQGLALEVEPLAAPDLAEVLRQTQTAPPPCVILALDQVSDPHNIGAVVRSAAAFSALAVILVARSAPPLAGAVAKAASGALEQVPLLRVVNLARTLEQLQVAGFWVCGLDETATLDLAQLDLGDRIVLVLGSEGTGMRRLVREQCDHVARLPTRAPLATLNVSNAAAIALYEITRRGSA
jgi:23S rRNA (guanosine2251-2'-O)-methyltransferase